MKARWHDGLPGYDEVQRRLQACADEGASVLALYGVLKRDYFPIWPPEARCSYDALARHVALDLGREPRVVSDLEATALAGGLFVEAGDQREGPTHAAVREALLALGMDLLEAGKLRMSIRDFIKLIELQLHVEELEHRKEEEVVRLREAAELYRDALDAFVVATGRASTDYQRDRIRDEIARAARKNPMAAAEARSATQCWNGIRPTRDTEVEGHLGRAERREAALIRVICEGGAASPQELTERLRMEIRRNLDLGKRVLAATATTPGIELPTMEEPPKSARVGGPRRRARLRPDAECI